MRTPIHARFADKADFLAKSKTYWNPGKTQFWQDAGIDLVIDRREGYFLHDLSGHRLIDMHLNGGTYNLGHRHPELVQALKDGLDHFDMGNHHFPALCRTALAEELHKAGPPALQYTIYGSGGGEAIDIALKSARHASGRRKIVSIIKAYHGHTGLAVCTGDPRFSELFLADRPDEFTQVPFNDLDAMEAALRGRDVAAVIMETIPATYGFPMPADGYLPAVKALCERYGAFYIADEVQTGLMRTGQMWAITGYGVTPDILVTAKGISGGLYTLGCVLVSEQTGAWLQPGRLRPYQHRRRRRARLPRGAEGAGDLPAPRGPGQRPRLRPACGPSACAPSRPLPRLLHRHPPERPRHGPGVRPSRGCEARHARASTRTASGRSSRPSTRACCNGSPAC